MTNCSADAALATLPTDIYPLRPLHREALRVVIEGPARLAGIDVEDHLVARLVEDTDTGEALPLLAFTLAQLAEGVRRGGQLSSRTLRPARRGARRPDPPGRRRSRRRHRHRGRGREQVIAGLLRLVTVDEQGRPTRWRVYRDELPDPVTAELDAFVARRLLTTDTDNGSVVIGVAHEAFLSAWPPLAQAIEENASALRARRAVEHAATEWNNTVAHQPGCGNAGNSPPPWPTPAPTSRPSDLVTDRVELSPTARAFLQASIRRDRYRRGRAVTVLSVLLVLALVASGFAFAQQRAAVHQRDVAVSRQVAGQAMELRAANPALAAQLGLAAYQLAPTTEARSSLLSIFATHTPPV